jgi:hypothetical protein
MTDDPICSRLCVGRVRKACLHTYSVRTRTQAAVCGRVPLHQQCGRDIWTEHFFVNQIDGSTTTVCANRSRIFAQKTFQFLPK